MGRVDTCDLPVQPPSRALNQERSITVERRHRRGGELLRSSAEEGWDRSLPDGDETVVSVERNIAAHATRALRLGGCGGLNAHSSNHYDPDRSRDRRTASPVVSRRFSAVAVPPSLRARTDGPRVCGPHIARRGCPGGSTEPHATARASKNQRFAAGRPSVLLKVR